RARERSYFPIPEHSQDAVEVLVTPPPPAHAPLVSPLPPGQQGPNLHLHVVADLTKRATRVAHAQVLHPPSHAHFYPRRTHTAPCPILTRQKKTTPPTPPSPPRLSETTKPPPCPSST